MPEESQGEVGDELVKASAATVRIATDQAKHLRPDDWDETADAAETGGWAVIIEGGLKPEHWSVILVSSCIVVMIC